MRRIERVTLAQATIEELQRFQGDADTQRQSGNLDPVKHWQGRRKSQPIITVLTALKRMVGTRERCMYCVDSEASDIEHFWPKSAHSDRMYAWANLLIACAQCGRIKGIQFPQADDGTPLLIDPTAENPWDSLDFDPVTGNLIARYLFSTGEYSAKGENTVRVLHLDKREGLSAGYRKTYGRLCRLVTEWTDGHLDGDYLHRLREADDHGLLGWFLHGSGRNEPPFVRFRETYQDAWAICQILFF